MLHCRSYIYVSFSKLSSMLYYKKVEQLKHFEYLIRRFSGLSLIPTILLSQLFRIIYNNKGNKEVLVHPNG